ncbi:hypothetical protein Prum_036510 [Phytohabitans rumicis]|uniref:Uncharacterized protein n=1 Tax=Phytohabitans rumicis TaxID=1076125 RepID=A0A6V8L5W8_9ACTN|nr:hypothetical protein Prum_036510 [Phytohabitans rumicis]
MAERIPTIVADDVHVVYRVIGAGTPGTGSPVASLRRIVTRSRPATVREVHAVKGVSFTAYRGRRSGSSAATAPASRRCCGRSPGCCRPTGAGSTRWGSRPCWA